MNLVPDSKGQGHDRKGYSSAALGGSPGHHGPEDHGHCQDVAVGEEGEEVVLQGQTPPGIKNLKVGARPIREQARHGKFQF